MIAMRVRALSFLPLLLAACPKPTPTNIERTPEAPVATAATQTPTRPGSEPLAATTDAALPSLPVPSTRVPAFAIDGYFPGYEAGRMPVSQVHFQALSRLMVARVTPRADGSIDTSFDTQNGGDFASRAVQAAHQAGRKAILMVGGEGARPGFLAARDAAKRKMLVLALTRYARELRFDGLDVDWEPIQAEDHAPLLALIDELRSAAPTLEFSVPVGWDAKMDVFYGDLAKRVSRINIMTYAMAGPWPQWSSWHSSALRGDAPETPSSVARAVKSYLDSGVPREKLGVGAGFFGMCWQKVSGPSQKLMGGASVAAGDGTLPYVDILRTYKPLAEKSGSVSFDETAQVPHLTFKAPSGPKSCSWISYEDERSLRAKAQYIRAEHLAGIVIWTLPQGFLTERSTEPLLQVLAEEATR